MATEIEPFSVHFPDWYDDRAEFETPAKGWLDGVTVQLEDGTRYALCFYDPVRLQQTLDDDAKAGRPYFGEPGLVVVPEVTSEGIRTAVSGLHRQGFFRHLKPLP